jgi:hypothetical protein
VPEDGQVAQLVEQRTENPCVGGSIPSLATTPHAALSVFVNLAVSTGGTVGLRSSITLAQETTPRVL